MTGGAYGITYRPPNDDSAAAVGVKRRRARVGTWEIAAPPHVMLRLRKILPGVSATARSGVIVVSDTPDMALEIEMIRGRWPDALPMRTATAATRLRGQAKASRDRDTLVHQLYSGQRSLHLPEPARPGRDYQLRASNVAIETGCLLCAHELALGKSHTALLTLRAEDALPAVVVCQTPKPMHTQWLRELGQTWPMLVGHAVTAGTPYDPTRKRGGPAGPPDVWVISYSKLAGWADEFVDSIGVRTVIFDEVQELRTGPGTTKYEAAGRLADACKYRLGLSASVFYNYGTEMFSIVEILSPGLLGTWEEFDREWCTTAEGTSKRIVADPEALGAYLREVGLLDTKTRKEVGREIPEPIIIEQPCEADPAKIDEYAGDALQLAKFLLDRDGKFVERGQAARKLDLEIRQATGIAKAPYVAEFVKMLLASGEPRVLLFGWHHAVYDVWRDLLAEHHPVFYTGEESGPQKQRAIDAFTKGNSRVLIMSLRSGAGLDGLQDYCRVAVFGELDWSPEVHRQGYGRLWRELTATRGYSPVVAYFLVADSGSDPTVAHILDIKRMQAEPILRPGGKLYTKAPDAAAHIRMLAEQVVQRHERHKTLELTG